MAKEQRWDMANAESHHLQAYVAQCEKKERPAALTILLQNGKQFKAELVELGAYVYVLDLIGEEGKKARTILNKSAIAMVGLG